MKHVFLIFFRIIILKNPIIYGGWGGYVPHYQNISLEVIQEFKGCIQIYLTQQWNLIFRQMNSLSAPSSTPLLSFTPCVQSTPHISSNNSYIPTRATFTLQICVAHSSQMYRFPCSFRSVISPNSGLTCIYTSAAIADCYT